MLGAALLYAQGVEFLLIIIIITTTDDAKDYQFNRDKPFGAVLFLLYSFWC